MTGTPRTKELADVGIAVLDCEHRTPAAQRDGHPYIAIPDIRDGRVILDNARRISDADLADWTKRTRPEPGDIIVTRRGRVGDTAPVPPDIPCAIGQNLVILRATTEEVDQAYLRWATRSPEWWSEVDRLMNVGAVFNSLNVRDIARIRLTFPSPTKQKAIAEVLGALDDKIAANTRVLELLNELAAAEVALLTSSSTVPLSQIATITMGSSPAGEDLNTTGTGIPFYQGVRDFGMRFPNYRVWTERPQRLAEPGDTLLSVRAPVGRVNIARDASCIGRGVASIRSKTGSPFTLFHLLAANDKAWLPFESEGTVFGSINRRQLESAPVPVVPELIASDLERRLTSLEARLAGATLENERLASTRDALLPALMSGKLRVRDAEKVVSDAL